MPHHTVSDQLKEFKERRKRRQALDEFRSRRDPRERRMREREQLADDLTEGFDRAMDDAYGDQRPLAEGIGDALNRAASVVGRSTGFPGDEITGEIAGPEIRQAMGSTIKGATETLTGIPKFLSGLRPRRRLEDHQERIEAQRERAKGLPPIEARRSWREFNQEMARLQSEADPVSEGALYRLGTAIDEFVEGQFPDEEGLEDSFWLTQVPRGFGSTAGFMVGGFGGAAARALATRGAVSAGRGAGAVTSGSMGAAVTGAEQYEDALRHGADEYTARQAMFVGAGPGALEALPVMQAIGRFTPRMAPNFQSAFGRGLTQAAQGAIEEAVQEGLQTVGANAIAMQFYDTDRELAEGLVEATEVGGIVGGGTNFLISFVSSMLGVRMRPGPGYDPYGIVGVKESAPIEEIEQKVAERLTKLGIKWTERGTLHPESNPDEDAVTTMENLFDALQIISEQKALEEILGEMDAEEAEGPSLGPRTPGAEAEVAEGAPDTERLAEAVARAKADTEPPKPEPTPEPEPEPEPEEEPDAGEAQVETETETEEDGEPDVAETEAEVDEEGAEAEVDEEPPAVDSTLRNLVKRKIGEVSTAARGRGVIEGAGLSDEDVDALMGDALVDLETGDVEAAQGKIAQVQRVTAPDPKQPHTTPPGFFEGMGPTKAYRKFQETFEGDYDVPTIRDALVQGGVKAKSATALLTGLHSIRMRDRQAKERDDAQAAETAAVTTEMGTLLDQATEMENTVAEELLAQANQSLRSGDIEAARAGLAMAREELDQQKMRDEAPEPQTFQGRPRSLGGPRGARVWGARVEHTEGARRPVPGDIVQKTTKKGKAWDERVLEVVSEADDHTVVRTERIEEETEDAGDRTGEPEAAESGGGRQDGEGTGDRPGDRAADDETRPVPEAAAEGRPGGVPEDGGAVRPTGPRPDARGEGGAGVRGEGRAVEGPRLPREIEGAKPLYGYREANYTPDFESDVDRAMYITAQPRKSPKDAQYRLWLRGLGYTDAEIDSHGPAVREALKAEAAATYAKNIRTGPLYFADQLSPAPGGVPEDGGAVRPTGPRPDARGEGGAGVRDEARAVEGLDATHARYREQILTAAEAIKNINWRGEVGRHVARFSLADIRNWVRHATNRDDGRNIAKLLEVIHPRLRAVGNQFAEGVQALADAYAREHGGRRPGEPFPPGGDQVAEEPAPTPEATEAEPAETQPDEGATEAVTEPEPEPPPRIEREEIPVRSDEEQVEHYAEGFYHLDAHGVTGSVFIAEAAELLREAEKIGQAKKVGDLLEQAAESVRQRDPTLYDSGAGRALNLAIRDPKKGKMVLRAITAKIGQWRADEELLGYVQEGSYLGDFDFDDFLDEIGNDEDMQVDDDHLSGDEKALVDEKEAADQVRATPEAGSVKGRNYRLDPDTLKGLGTPIERARRNVEAIRLVKQLIEEERDATRDEQDVLARFVGWGGLKQVFKKNPPLQFSRIQKELRELLTKEEYDTANRSIQYAHYTQASIIEEMWKAVRRMGVKGRIRALEPGAGVGHFIGLSPVRAWWTAIEMDEMTAAILGKLYPQSRRKTRDTDTIGENYRDTKIAPNSLDLVIGNPPFSRTRLQYGSRKHSLHDFFFVKSLDKLRPGGVLAMVTSTYTMDKVSDKSRREMARMANFLGAVRLPSTAFAENAATEVTTDIIFFQKRAPGEAENHVSDAWFGTTTIPHVERTTNRWGHTLEREMELRANRYFVENPEMVLGVWKRNTLVPFQGDNDQVQVQHSALERRGGPLPDQLAAALAHIPDDIYEPGYRPEVAEVEEGALAGIRAGQFVVRRTKDGNRVFKREGDRLAPVEALNNILTPAGNISPVRRKTLERVVSLIEINEAAREVLRVTREWVDDATLEAAQEKLNTLYDAFRDKYGPINKEVVRKSVRKPAFGKLREDDSVIVTTLTSNLTHQAKGRIAAIDEKTKTFTVVDQETGASDVLTIKDVKIETTSTSQPNLKGYTDQTSAIVRSLDRFDMGENDYVKTDIFTKRLSGEVVETTSVEEPYEGVLESLRRHGEIDMTVVRELTGRTEAQLVEALADKVFRDPVTDSYLIASEYLSGNVREKLALAKEAAETDKFYERNVKALEGVQPERIRASTIRKAGGARIGSTWVPTDEYVRFALQELGLRLNIEYRAIDGAYSVTRARAGSGAISNLALYEKFSVNNYEAYNSGDALAIFSRLMKGGAPRVTQTIEYQDDMGQDRTRTVRNPKATSESVRIAAQMQARFEEWLLKDDPKRATEMTDLWNTAMNHSVAPTFDGAFLDGHFKGIARTFRGRPFSFRPHQLNAIWRIASSGNTMLMHSTGSGKTFVMAGAAMLAKQLGAAHKPMIVVPNAILNQFAGEFNELFPGANILIADAEQMRARQQLFSDIATSDWDAVVVPMSQFTNLAVSPNVHIRYLGEMLSEFREALEHGGGDRFTERDIQQKIEQYEEKIRELSQADRDPDELFFEDLGVDMVFIDEAHNFKNLSLPTFQLTNIDASKRATLLHLISRHLNSINPGRGLVLSTATPISNDVGELYRMLRYLDEDSLRRDEYGTIDAWAHNYVAAWAEMDYNDVGQLEEVYRPRAYAAPHSLKLLWKQRVDVIENKDLAFGIPTLVDWEGNPTDQPNVLVVEGPNGGADPRLVNLMAANLERWKTVREMGQEEARMLLGETFFGIMWDGRKASLDERLVVSGPGRSVLGESKPFARSKVEVAAERLLSFLDDTKDVRATAMVFSEFGVEPRGVRGYSFYEDLKLRLIEGGIPASEIAFIRDAKDAREKQEMINKMNRGEIRVMLGTSQNLGTGVNAQKRLGYLLHMDAPWRPMDIQQREGRILRQGNILFEQKLIPGVRIDRMVMRGSYDAKIWNVLERKIRPVEQLMNATPTTGLIEVPASGMSTGDMYAIVKGSAATNPFALDLERAKADLSLLQGRRDSHDERQDRRAEQLIQFEDGIKFFQDQLHWLKLDAAAIERNIGEGGRGEFKGITIDGKRYTDYGEAKTALYDAFGELQAYGARLKKREAKDVIGSYGGLDVEIVVGRGGQFSGSLGYYIDIRLLGVPEARRHGETTPRPQVVRQKHRTLQVKVLASETASGWMKESDMLRRVTLLGRQAVGAVDDNEARIRQHQRELKLLRESVNQPFEDEARLQQLEEEVKVLERRFNEFVPEVSAEDFNPQTHGRTHGRTYTGEIKPRRWTDPTGSPQVLPENRDAVFVTTEDYHLAGQNEEIARIPAGTAIVTPWLTRGGTMGFLLLEDAGMHFAGDIMYDSFPLEHIRRYEGDLPDVPRVDLGGIVGTAEEEVGGYVNDPKRTAINAAYKDNAVTTFGSVEAQAEVAAEVARRAKHLARLNNPVVGVGGLMGLVTTGALGGALAASGPGMVIGTAAGGIVANAIFAMMHARATKRLEQAETAPPPTADPTLEMAKAIVDEIDNLTPGHRMSAEDKRYVLDLVREEGLSMDLPTLPPMKGLKKELDDLEAEVAKAQEEERKKADRTEYERVRKEVRADKQFMARMTQKAERVFLRRIYKPSTAAYLSENPKRRAEAIRDNMAKKTVYMRRGRDRKRKDTNPREWMQDRKRRAIDFEVARRLAAETLTVEDVRSVAEAAVAAIKGAVRPSVADRTWDVRDTTDPVLRRQLVAGTATPFFAWTDIRGQRIRDPEDAFRLLREFARSKTQETLHLVGVRGDGTIVFHNAVSSGAPHYVTVIKDHVAQMAQMVNDTGAEKVYLVHNHPSGNATPSPGDQRMHQALAKHLADQAEYGPARGAEIVSVVINSDHFTTYDGTEQETHTFGDLPPGPAYETAKNATEAALIFHRLRADQGAMHILYRDAAQQAVAVEPVPAGWRPSKAELRERMRDHGAVDVVIGVHGDQRVEEVAAHFESEKATNPNGTTVGAVVDVINTDARVPWRVRMEGRRKLADTTSWQERLVRSPAVEVHYAREELGGYDQDGETDREPATEHGDWRKANQQVKARADRIRSALLRLDNFRQEHIENKKADVSAEVLSDALRVLTETTIPAKAQKLLAQAKDADKIGQLLWVVSQARVEYRNQLRRYAIYQLKQAISSAGIPKMHPDFLQDIRAVLGRYRLAKVADKATRKKLGSTGRKSLYRLAPSDIASITNRVLAIAHEHATEKQLVGARKGKAVKAAAASVVSEAVDRTDPLPRGRAIGRIGRLQSGAGDLEGRRKKSSVGRFLSNFSVRPADLMEHLSPTLREIGYDDVSIKGYHRETELLFSFLDPVKRAAGIAAGQKVGTRAFERWRTKTFELRGVEITRGEAVQLYLTMFDPTNAGLIFKHGATLDRSRKHIRMDRETYHALKEIVGEDGRVLARAMYQLFNGQMKHALNRAWVEVYGYEIADVVSYVPRKVDMREMDPKNDPLAMLDSPHDPSVTTWGHLKSRIGAGQPLRIGDAMTSFSSHASHVARISAYLAPVHNVHKILERPDVRKTIEARAGERGYRRIIDSVKQQSVKYYDREEGERVARRFRRNAAVHILGLRASTWFLNPSGLAITAGAEALHGHDGYKWLMEALPSGANPAEWRRIQALAKRYAPYWRQRYEGSFLNEVTAGLAGEAAYSFGPPTLGERTLVPLQYSDRFGAIVRWKMAEIKVAETTELEVGSDEYHDEVAQEWMRMMFSGENSSHGGDLSGDLALGHRNAFYGFMSMFRSAVMRIYSLNWAAFQEAKRKGGNKAWAAAGFTGVFMSLGWATAVRALLDLLDDDDEPPTVGSLAGRFLGEAAGTIPLVGNIAIPTVRAALQGGSRIYSASVLEDAFMDAASTLRGLYKTTELLVTQDLDVHDEPAWPAAAKRSAEGAVTLLALWQGVPWDGPKDLATWAYRLGRHVGGGGPDPAELEIRDLEADGEDVTQERRKLRRAIRHSDNAMFRDAWRELAAKGDTLTAKGILSTVNRMPSMSYLTKYEPGKPDRERLSPIARQQIDAELDYRDELRLSAEQLARANADLVTQDFDEPGGRQRRARRQRPRRERRQPR